MPYMSIGMSALKVDANASLAWAAVATIMLALVFHGVKSLYLAFSGPLAKVPGPFMNKISGLPLKIAVLSGRRVFYIQRLHQQYGSFVILAPGEVSVSEIASVKDIHKIGTGFLKSDWYTKFTPPEPDEQDRGIFPMQNPKLHAARRKLFSKAFSKQAILGWEDVIQDHVKKAVAGIQMDIATYKGADILAWLTYMANDVISTLSFGESFGSLEAGRKTPFIQDLERVAKMGGIRAELPWLKPLLARFSPEPLIGQRASEAIYKSRKLAREEGISYRGTLFEKMLDGEDQNALTMKQIIIESIQMVVAGSDTTAVTSTYLIWSILCMDSALRQRLLQEVATLPEKPTAQEAADLPFLSQVIQEALRLYGAAPGSLPRVVPVGGRILGGYFLPEGATVSTEAWVLHRNPDIFADPDKFDPDRWASPTQGMKDSFMPFGGGARVCMGMHLAWLEMALVTVLFFRAIPYARLASETTPASMEPENFFLIAPRSHRCIVTA